MPRQTKSAFDIQHEISLLAGILPHYIIGIEFLKDNEFYFNSNILENGVNDAVFMFGLNINQDNFFNVLKETSFRKSFNTTRREIYENTASR